jgi:putative ABC transport system ATP-binding protein
MRNVLLRGQDVCKAFSQNGEITQILDHISVDIYEGDFTVIMGASGAGKSTLLYALSGMDKITGGSVFYKENDISNFNENKMAELRAKELGFVFQQTHLVSNLTLFENVAIAGYIGKTQDTSAIKEKAMDLLEKMHAVHAKDRLPSQVSGGEAQRAAIARAMINDPGIIFADEPTGALNKGNSEEVMNLLSYINENGQSILMVTHDMKAALRGNRILYLEDGKILDELLLPVYRNDDIKSREAKVSDWLSSLQW